MSTPRELVDLWRATAASYTPPQGFPNQDALDFVVRRGMEVVAEEINRCADQLEQSLDEFAPATDYPLPQVMDIL